MKRAVLIALALVGCGDGGTVPPDAPLGRMDLQVVATPDGVNVYKPVVAEECPAAEPFPALGACAYDSDFCANPEQNRGCFTSFELVSDAGVITSTRPDWNNVSRLGIPAGATGVTFVARGCGGEASIALDLHGPAPTLTASSLSDGVYAAWTTDRPAAGALVQSGFQTCHVSGTSAHIVFPGWEDMGSIPPTSVYTLDPPNVVTTPEIQITAYSAGFAVASSN